MIGLPAATPMRRLRSAAEVVRAFYQRPIAWGALIVSSATLCYGGGAAMFWFHALIRGEHGPAISDVHHWWLDSSLGFVALTPAIALLLPIGVWAGAGSSSADKVRLGIYVGLVATVFTLVTGPGPLLHDRIAGADTPLARAATRFFGEDSAVVHRNMQLHDRSPVVEGVLQVAVGFPVYLGCTWLALQLVRVASRRNARVRAAELRFRSTPAPECSPPGGGRW